MNLSDTNAVRPSRRFDLVINLNDVPCDRRTISGWPIADWARQGVHTRFFQCEPFLYEGFGESMRDCGLIQQFETEKAFSRALSFLDPARTFFLVYFHVYERKRHRLFRILEAGGFRYGLIVTDGGDLPLEPGPEPGWLDNLLRPGERRWKAGVRTLWRALFIVYSYCRRFLSTFLEYLNPLNIPIRFYQSVQRRVKWLGGIRGPDFWILRCQGAADHYFPDSFPAGRETRIVWTHSHVYDDFLAEKSKSAPAEDVVLYLDQYLPYLSDIGVQLNITPERYYTRIQDLARFIGERFSCPVVMTSHPWARAEKVAQWAAPMRYEQGTSAALTRSARFVVGLSSTALFYAVLYRKPLIIITTDEVEGTFHAPPIHGFARALGKIVINLDRVRLHELDWDALLHVDDVKYAEVEAYYIKKSGAPERPTWDIVLDAIQKTGF